MKKINPVVWAVLAVPVIYMAMVLACSYEAGTDLFALMERFGLLLGRPDLLRWTAYTPRFLLVFLLLYGGGVFYTTPIMKTAAQVRNTAQPNGAMPAN